MDIQTAAEILARMYSTAPEGEKVLRIHLFGIQYADVIRSMSCKDLAERAGISPKYGTEIAKARKLAAHVRLRE